MNASFPTNPGAAGDPIDKVADAWLAFLRDPEQGFDPLRDEIEAMIYRLLKPRSLGGFFDGCFERIVQQSVWLTLARFLTGNRKLVAATRDGNRATIRVELLRSIWLAMQATMWQTRTIASRSTAATPSRSEESEKQVRANLRDTIECLGLLPSG